MGIPPRVGWLGKNSPSSPRATVLPGVALADAMAAFEHSCAMWERIFVRPLTR